MVPVPKCLTRDPTTATDPFTQLADEHGPRFGCLFPMEKPSRSRAFSDGGDPKYAKLELGFGVPHGLGEASEVGGVTASPLARRVARLLRRSERQRPLFASYKSRRQSCDMDPAKAAKHFAILRDAEERCQRWAREVGVSIHCFQSIATFEDWDESVHVRVFFPTDQDLQTQKQSGFTKLLESKYRELLSAAGYDFESFPHLSFGFDSDQNVQENFEGSYFYRLR